jgi:ferredoxin
MQLHLDRTRCEGHGQCEAAAPRLIHLDDDATPIFDVGGEVPAELEDDARAAVSYCPVAALSAS